MGCYEKPFTSQSSSQYDLSDPNTFVQEKTNYSIDFTEPIPRVDFAVEHEYTQITQVLDHETE